MNKHTAYKQVVAGTKSEAGYAFISEDHAKALAADGLVEVNPEMRDAVGNIATRALDTSIEVHPDEAAMKVKPTFEIVGGLAPAAIVRPPLPAREEIYPFSKLEIGQSFYLPGEMKKYVSTVTAANRRFKVPSPDGATKTNRKGETVPVLLDTRKFVLRSVTEGHKYDNGFVEPASGSRVFRIA